MSDSEVDDDRAGPNPDRFGLRAAFRTALPSADWPSGSSAQVAVALFELADWMTWLDDAALLLDAGDLARAQRQRRPQDQDRLILTYALHRLLLGARMGVDAVAVPLLRDALGCPRLQDAAISTSLTHAGRWVAAAVTGAGPVGVDIEPAERTAVMAKIASRVCHPNELAALAGMDVAAYRRALLALWVRKEALLKAAGVGMAREMDTFEAPDESSQPLSPPEPQLTHLQMLDIGPELVGAIAAPPGASVETVWMRHTVPMDRH
ncbi:4'-phosphopantetheinyl transferase superfamily protein [Lysobacter ciconiae]|uniref:4'-phosphopantetheinyl transferase superfamily protein n=1 Tax=Novilysobacter ciconiae TaxID=2781022 RepID=A0A7S6ZRS6_9GAMM|nr:4'-phosphopantetheinyl transferase superfamily protein [Lysobacter ciconiae]QOW18809.1 4'-phosphopantetheinyl transferase superfamily protein [Lysobacter ciconiae]